MNIVNLVHPVLYKLNLSGKILEWFVEQEGERYRTVSGLELGQYTISAWTTAIATNTGKKNALNSFQQASKEIKAKYNHKTSKGSYVISKNDLYKPTFIKPMLAATYYSETFNPESKNSKIKNNIPSTTEFRDGIIIQRKLDGIRMILSKDGAYSRNGALILGAPHITQPMQQFFNTYPHVILDGELYNHTLGFDVISGTIRRELKQDNTEQQLIRKSISFFVYDLINHSIYKERALLLNNLSLEFPSSVVLLEGSYVKDLTEVTRMHNKFVQQGYEGAILRKINAKYQQNTRTKDLLKVKQFQDAEFTILDIIEGDGNNAGMAAKIMISVNDILVYPNMAGSWDFCRKVLEEKEQYIGGIVTVKFFGKTPEGSLRFPIVKILYKTEKKL